MRFLEKTLAIIVRQAIQLDISTKSKPYTHDSIGFKIYYFGTSIILGLLGYILISSTESFLPMSLFSLLFLGCIIFTLYIYDSISNKRKIDLSDEFIIRPPVLRKRKQSFNNWGFNFTNEQIERIFKKLYILEFIHRETSFESFYNVFMSDFGHNCYVQFNTSLSQTNKILTVLKRHSKDFEPSLAFRKKHFLSNKGTKINIGSYNNAKSFRNKKNEEFFFKDDFTQFNEFMKRLIDKNDEK